MNDLIDRQAAIDAVKDLLGSMLETDTIGFYEIEHALFEVPSAQQWIPISERQPERCDYYLVTDSGLAGEAYYGSDRRWWADGNKLKDVKAWMPLPKPYTEDKG